jgi:signal transduction histidine kinase
MRTVLRGNTAIYGLIALLAVLSLMVLFRLRQQFENNLQGRVADLQRVFSNRALLKPPTDYKITFADIEAEAAKYENRGDFGAIRITKRFGNSEHTIYPFYYPALAAAGLPEPSHVSPHDKPAGLFEGLFSHKLSRELPLTSDGEILGSLIVDVNYSALRTVSVVIWALSAMLAAALAFLAGQFRRQEKVISATTIELDEKRRELVRLERLALAGQLSANILHDLKKPVLNIRNEADEALQPEPGIQMDPPATVFARVREQADFFLSVLREGGFDRFVRAQEEREYVDVNDLLERSLALVRYEQGSVQIQRQYSEKLPAVLTEPVRLIQVFSNIILNACQAMNGRGDLIISSSQNTDNTISVVITDNGPGIASEQLDRVFEPFYTTKPAGQGTGLGLYIVQDILRELGGSISVSSQPGRTIFQMIIPASG